MNKYQLFSSHPLKASAPAKIILFGEHAVVYGHPAIAVPVSSVRAFAEIRAEHSLKAPYIQAKDFNIEYSLANPNPPREIKHIIKAIRLVAGKFKRQHLFNNCSLNVWSQIPIARGLGSSAAISVALIKTLYKFFDKNLSQSTLIDLSFELEKYHHGRPSGIDNTVIALERPILFEKGRKIQVINPQRFYFIIGDTGIAKNTGQVVAEVARLYEANQSHYNSLFQSIGEITNMGLMALEQGNQIQLGQLMTQNQALLAQIGVSSPELENLIEAAIHHGALGAKLCGAGQGGCMAALATNQQQAYNIADALAVAGAQHSFVTILKGEG